MTRMPDQHIDVDDLVRRRQAANMTQRDLGDVLGTSAHVVERWETPSPRRRAVSAKFWPILKATLGIEPVPGPFTRWAPPVPALPAAPPPPPKPVMEIIGTCPCPQRHPQWQCTWCGVCGSGDPDSHRCRFIRLSENKLAMARLSRILAERDVTES